MSSLSSTALSAAIEAALIPEVRQISRTLEKNGHHSWIVGGCVRDIALDLSSATPGKRTGDWDLATSAEPKQVLRLFRHVIPTGVQHGTVTVVLGGQNFELTTLRGERGHSDGRRPDEVYFVDDIEADLARRDFTVNAIAYDIEQRLLHDPFGGLDDLAAKRLRAVGDASLRFSEDGLRVLRGARFCSTLDFTLDEDARRAIRPSLDSFRKVAQERVQQEWLKALGGSHPQRFVQVALEEGLLEITAPDLFQEPGHLEVDQLLGRLASFESAAIARMALLVVAGCPRAVPLAELSYEAARQAKTLGKRLKLSREHLKELVQLAEHCLPPSELLSACRQASDLRRYLAQIGRHNASALFEFQRLAHLDKNCSAEELRELHEALTASLRSGAPLFLAEVAIKGQDLMKLGVPKGPQIGQLLAHLLECVIEAPERNRFEPLADEAREWLRSSRGVETKSQ